MRLRRWRRVAVPVGALAALTVVLLAVPTVGSGSARRSQGSASGVVVPSGVTPPAPPGSAGRTVAGLNCHAGVRQVPWSVYAPECSPAYWGNNGGSSWPGVTRRTITLTYRLASSSALQEIYTFFPKDVVGDNTEAIATLQAYVKFFNHYFELYGRHAVLKTFSGEGNFVNELTGTGQEGAQHDAVQEQAMGTFADLSLADTSPIFVNDLASLHIISFTQWPPDLSWFRQNAPYAYATGADCNKRSKAVAAFASRELVFGAPGAQQGRIGYVYQATPYEEDCEAIFQHDLSEYGSASVDFASYSFDFATLISQASAIVSKMKADGVTAIALPSDPVSPGFFLQAAQAQNYFPDWLIVPFFADGAMEPDPLGTLYSAAEMAHAYMLGIADGPVVTSESYKAFQEGCRLPPVSDCSDPLPPYSLAVAYANVLMLFDGIQAAGPWLTPQNFAAGLAQLPGGPSSGMFGQWSFGPGTVDPPASFQVLKWQPSAISPIDDASIPGTTIQEINGGKGRFVPCNGGTQYLYADPQLPQGPPNCPDS